MPAQAHAEFPCSLVIDIPFPSARLASAALRALRVDRELSPLVRRDITTIPPATAAAGSDDDDGDGAAPTVLRTEYAATTNRMLRVAVNGFMASVDLVIGVMQELDLDVLEPQPSAG